MKSFHAVSLLLGLGLTELTAQACGDEAYLKSSIASVSFAKDQWGDLDMTLREAEAQISKCPQNETDWYALLRIAEIMAPKGHISFRGPSGRFANLGEAVDWARAHLSKSARITTIAARIRHSEALAYEAVSVDPNYGPARAYLARLLFESGNAAQARDVLAKATDLDRIQGGPLLLARIRLALGDLDGALAVAERGTVPHGPNFFIEPNLSDIQDVKAARTFLAEHSKLKH